MKYVKAIIGVFLLICIDQYTKYIVLQRLVMFEYHPILGNLFGLMYIDNPGMAWGMLPNKQIVFLILTVFVLAAIVFFYIKLSKQDKFLPVLICLQFLTAGAIGNMIDRIFRGEELFQGAVIDFLYIKCIDFPVFNFADMCVTFSITALILLLIFKYKEQDFDDILSFKKKHNDTSLAAQDSDESLVETSNSGSKESEYLIHDNEKNETINIDNLFQDEEEEDE